MMKPSAPPSHDAGAVAPPAQRVLDIEDGLDRIMGDRVLYFKLLRRFQHDHHSTPHQVRSALAAGQYASARLQAHTLKGAAGMVGARAVHTLAAALEAALRAQSSTLELPLEQLELALTELLNAISAVLPAVSAQQAAAPDAVSDPDDPATLALLARLAALLRDGDGAALDVLESSAATLAASLGVGAYQEVAAAAHEFDFDGAWHALTRRRQ
ncbi:Hpt domain-containing protein [Janthinobacterium fluminis]|uniref:Hpt domain-containing protein n=1 Tax=Janthinobacterium fluminis TaxID=2987524 RepID=A0ABT5JZJ0_9BURK|nr:Hpt domain-containing protein [Janthinobacterium fluminis]MDC8758147.1 Hpt domain-containing protein [Janthinobacterium fluminis]